MTEFVQINNLFIRIVPKYWIIKHKTKPRNSKPALRFSFSVLSVTFTTYLSPYPAIPLQQTIINFSREQQPVFPANAIIIRGLIKETISF